jgi:hypothetical protein
MKTYLGPSWVVFIYLTFYKIFDNIGSEEKEINKKKLRDKEKKTDGRTFKYD